MVYRLLSLLALPAILSLMSLLGGCAATPTRSVVAEVPPDHGRMLPIFHDGAPTTWSQVIADAASADAVAVGELHGQPWGQALEAALFADVLKAAPNACAALEFFERDEQLGLDDYLRGVGDEEALRKSTNRTPGNYTPGHRAIVEACKAAKRPVIAANAPRRYVRLSRTENYERLINLGDEQRRMYRIPDSLPTGRYRDEFMKMMTSGEETHGSKGKTPEPTPEEQASKQKVADGMFRAHSLWDWTMSESVAKAVGEAGPKTGRPVVLIVGEFHVGFEGGLIQALRQQKPGVKIVTISMVDIDDETPREEDKTRATYVVHVAGGKGHGKK